MHAPTTVLADTAELIGLTIAVDVWAAEPNATRGPSINRFSTNVAANTISEYCGSVISNGAAALEPIASSLVISFSASIAPRIMLPPTDADCGIANPRASSTE
ncbi:hypothetical protein MCC01967_07010 [Bifidobacteriaceae bacterium MCC01967]|nr:hypothetical protein MCC01967_07010 [Bifidobacteriaceae bacterium MCC01967]GDZ64149.1 hypothetical protein MCC02038_09890 [Bifidobacteriaceae bacterium MCC02038]